MLLSKSLRIEIEEHFEKLLPQIGFLKESLLSRLSECEEDRQILLKFLYSSMPMNDIADYDFSMFLGYVEHALFLREHLEWTKEIPERIFLNDIVHYRINSENIVDCRKYFYDILYPRVQGKTMEQAILEINYWCAENVLYKASDIRTAAPMTVYQSGTGRCGEESTFTVTALRSVGIPARQVYTPRWAHCDDNHAWVEVWCEGEWHFIGACEPEEVLNVGWFTKAASRALLIHSRNFSFLNQDHIISQEGLLTYLGHTGFYAKTKEVEIQVITPQGQPVQGARVVIQILNSSEYAKAAAIVTDQRGSVRITLGQGDIKVHVDQEGRYSDRILRAEEEQLTLVMDDIHPVKERWIDDTIKAPQEFLMHPNRQTAEQLAVNKQRLELCEQKRNEKLARYDRGALIYNCDGINEILRAARANRNEVIQFATKDDNPYREKLLKILAPKDYFDLKAAVLEEHLECALSYRDQLNEDIFCHYVLSPRISYEFITAYRRFILDYFTEEEKQSFRKKPAVIWDYIGSRITYCKDRDYDLLITSPAASLKSRSCNEISRKVLFVAICRSLGIPARLDTTNSMPQYYDGSDFVHVITLTDTDSARGVVVINFPEGHQWNYDQTWTIGKLVHGIYATLDYSKEQWKGNQVTLSLVAGEYRIITANREPQGDTLVSEYHFDVRVGETKYITMHQNTTSDKKQEALLELPEICFEDLKGNRVSLKTLVQNRRSVFLWLEEGKEPTEHILTELLEQQEVLQAYTESFHIILKGKQPAENKTLAKVLTHLTGIKVYRTEEKKELQKLTELLQAESEKLPYVIVANDRNQAVYTSIGYNVGSVAQIIKAISQ